MEIVGSLVIPTMRKALKNNMENVARLNLRDKEKFLTCAIYTANNDLSKRWFVRIKVLDFSTGIYKYKKVYGNVNKFSTVEERLQEMDLLLTELNTNQYYLPQKGSRYIDPSAQSLAPTGPPDQSLLIYQLDTALELRKFNLRPVSYKKYQGHLDTVKRWLLSIDRIHLPLQNFSPLDAKLFLNYLQAVLKISNSIYNAHLTLLKSLFEDLTRAKLVPGNPFEGFKRLPKNSTPSLYYQPFQVELIKDYCSKNDPQLWLFVQFIFYCFIRPGELRQLLISDILFNESKILVRKEISKNKKSQYVTMPRVLLQELIKLNWHRRAPDFYAFGSEGIPGKIPIGINYMKIKHQKILKDLGINTIRHKLYSWKHTGAVRFAKAGGSLKDLQLQLRHHSLDQVDHYLKDMLSGESEAILNLPPI